MKNNLFKKIMKDKEKRRTKLAALSFAEKIEQLLAAGDVRNIKAVILYGSWAKGTAREDSDVDLLVIKIPLKTTGVSPWLKVVAAKPLSC